MLNFELYNPTNLVFGKGQIKIRKPVPKRELKYYIVGGSIFKNGIRTSE
jgi:NADP-dependent alcohol dehydrogenase